MMRFLILSLFLSSAFAHEISSSYQYWWLKGPNVSSWRGDVAGEVQLDSTWQGLFQATHFERFEEQDQTLKLGARYKKENSYWEFSHTDGGNNKVLAIRETLLTHGRAITSGLGGWLTVRSQGFATSDVNLLTLGLEMEKAPGWFFIPAFTGGKASFHSPAETNNIWALAARLGKYAEGKWKYWLHFARGEEAQALATLNQTKPLGHVNYGAGGEWILSDWTLGLFLERSWYPSVNTRFDSALLTTKWHWGK